MSIKTSSLGGHDMGGMIVVMDTITKLIETTMIEENASPVKSKICTGLDPL